MAGRSFEVCVNPQLIKWARESAGWSVEEISEKLKTSKENFEKIESGKKPPTFKQLEILSYYFKRPVAIFFLPEPPEEPSLISSFRILPKRESEVSKDLRFAIRKARYYQSIMNELLKELGLDSRPKITTATLNNNPIEVAQKERERMQITFEQQFNCKNAYEAFNIWRNAIESKNILTLQFNFPITDARGFSLMDKDPVVIALNSTDNILARIFTLFHEYAHIILGITEIYVEEINTNWDVENWCNTFASEILIPEEILKHDEYFQKFQQYGKLEKEILQNISEKFKVSKKAVLTRLKTLNLISQKDYEQEVASLAQQISHKRGGFIKPTQKCLQEKGKYFISSVLQSRERGIITTQDAIEYLSIKLKHLDKLKGLISR